MCFLIYRQDESEKLQPFEYRTEGILLKTVPFGNSLPVKCVGDLLYNTNCTVLCKVVCPAIAVCVNIQSVHDANSM